MVLAGRNFFENCLRQILRNFSMAGLIRPSCCGGTCIVFFLLLRMSQRWRGLNAIGHFTGQHVAVMHHSGILSFIETYTAATLWVGSSATDKLCATLRNPARSHHPVFPERRRSSAHLQAAAALRTTLTCQSCVPVRKEKEGRVAEAVAAAPGEREKGSGTHLNGCACP